VFLRPRYTDMVDDSNKDFPRSFLKVSGVGLATLASRPVWAQGASEAPVSTRNKPIEPLVLRSRALELVRIVRRGALRVSPPFRQKPFCRRRLGAPLKGVICDRTHWAFHDVALAVAKIKTTNSQADFYFNATEESKTAASFYAAVRVEKPRFTSRWRTFKSTKDMSSSRSSFPIGAVREEETARVAGAWRYRRQPCLTR